MRGTLEFGCQRRVQVGVDRVFDRVRERLLGELAQRRFVEMAILRTQETGMDHSPCIEVARAQLPSRSPSDRAVGSACVEAGGDLG